MLAVQAVAAGHITVVLVVLELLVKVITAVLVTAEKITLVAVAVAAQVRLV
jgi:hypothetical protein